MSLLIQTSYRAPVTSQCLFCENLCRFRYAGSLKRVYLHLQEPAPLGIKHKGNKQVSNSCVEGAGADVMESPSTSSFIALFTQSLDLVKIYEYTASNNALLRA